MIKSLRCRIWPSREIERTGDRSSRQILRKALYERMEEFWAGDPDDRTEKRDEDWLIEAVVRSRG